MSFTIIIWNEKGMFKASAKWARLFSVSSILCFDYVPIAVILRSLIGHSWRDARACINTMH
jgi:hypothetical protein